MVVDGPPRPAATVFGADGWRRGDPRLVFPDGPPPDAQSVSLDLPDWLVGQLAQLELALGGVHTDFIRVDRLLARLHTQAANGAVIVLGPRPAAVVVQQGRLHVIEPAAPAGAPALSVLAGAQGWVLVFSGPVTVPAAAALPQPVAEPAIAERPQPVTTPPAPFALTPAPSATSAPATPPTPVSPPAMTDERFVASSSLLRSVPDDVAAEIETAAGDDGLAVVAYLDGSHSVAEIAQDLGLSIEQVSSVIRLLVSRKAAFRYVSRTRPATGAKSPG